MKIIQGAQKTKKRMNCENANYILFLFVRPFKSQTKVVSHPKFDPNIETDFIFLKVYEAVYRLQPPPLSLIVTTSKNRL